MTITWNGILERLQATSASLQSSDQDLNTGYALYESLYGYVQAMRSTFSDIEARAKDLTNCEEYQQQSSRRIKRNTKYDHFSGSTTFDDGFVENQTHGQHFEVQLKFLTTEEILEKSSNMVSAYEDDLENSLGGELVQFAELLKTDVAIVIDSKKQEPLEQQFYKFLINNSLGSCFPNLEIALRIYLSLMITNCSGERSFSTLKRIKTELRNTMGQERLNHLTLLNIEHDLLKEVDIENSTNGPRPPGGSSDGRCFAAGRVQIVFTPPTLSSSYTITSDRCRAGRRPDAPPSTTYARRAPPRRRSGSGGSDARLGDPVVEELLLDGVHVERVGRRGAEVARPRDAGAVARLHRECTLMALYDNILCGRSGVEMRRKMDDGLSIAMFILHLAGSALKNVRNKSVKSDERRAQGGARPFPLPPLAQDDGCRAPPSTGPESLSALNQCPVSEERRKPGVLLGNVTDMSVGCI
ncbi:Zinc finger MYM-type protein 1 [Eumeta japonica]|uniref:Zinc finger MYM-type protein 1 n=1 Tax=Eumeta variegata TaxID=151549 RepID=A0A4C1U3I6_EUMVA|nr:Zinc finger MYM-type protein 1 [Eumeta japonica]